MSDTDKQQAKEHAERASRQMKHAAANASEAAEAGAEYVKDEVTEGAQKMAARIQPHVAAYAVRQLGWGFVAMSLSVYTGAIAANKFKTAFEVGKTIIKNKP